VQPVSKLAIIASTVKIVSGRLILINHLERGSV